MMTKPINMMFFLYLASILSYSACWTIVGIFSRNYGMLFSGILQFVFYMWLLKYFHDRVEKQEEQEELLKKRNDLDCLIYQAERFINYRKRHSKVNKRAEELLLSKLSPEQKNEFINYGMFIVKGKSGKKYKLCYFSTGNILDLDEIICKCAVPSEEIPLEDQLLTQKIQLEIDDITFMKKANEVFLFPRG